MAAPSPIGLVIILGHQTDVGAGGEIYYDDGTRTDVIQRVALELHRVLTILRLRTSGYRHSKSPRPEEPARFTESKSRVMQAGVGMVGGFWVQGMLDQLDDAPMDWAEVLYLRLTAQFDRLRPRGKTEMAEVAMGWNHQAYFFVGRPHPHYGASVTLFEEPAASALNWAVSPFDTGGLLNGKIVTHKPLSAAALVALVRTWSLSGSSCQPAYEDWIHKAFASRGDYVRAGTPSYHLVKQIVVSSNTDHCWTWEGRFPAENYDIPLAAPHVVFLSSGRRQHFQEWVRKSGMVPQSDIASYMKSVAALIQETTNPVQAAQAILC